MEPLKEYIENQLIKKNKKIFISHNTEDSAFGDALFELIVVLIGNDPQKIFYSSKPKYGVSNGGNIIGTMKKQYEENELYFIVISSPRYYNSPKSLNEMGAAWALNSKYDVFLTNDCDISNLKGVYDSSSIAIQVNKEKKTIDRLDMFANDIADFFNVQIPNNWEDKRNEFIIKVNAIKYAPIAINESTIDSEIANQRDIQTLDNLFSNFSSKLIKEYFDNPIFIDDRLPLSHEIWCELRSSFTFHIYDSKLKELFDAFWYPWNNFMCDNYRYYEADSINSHRYKFIGFRCDVFFQNKDRYDYTIKQKKVICGSLYSLIQYVREKYIRLDIDKLESDFLQEIYDIQ